MKGNLTAVGQTSASMSDCTLDGILQQCIAEQKPLEVRSQKIKDLYQQRQKQLLLLSQWQVFAEAVAANPESSDKDIDDCRQSVQSIHDELMRVERELEGLEHEENARKPQEDALHRRTRYLAKLKSVLASPRN